MAEERRTSVNTRTPCYVNVLCKTHCSKIFCLRFVCDDNKVLALNKYYFLEMLDFAYLFATLYIYIHIYMCVCVCVCVCDQPCGLVVRVSY